MRVGSRAQVWHGTALMTRGGLRKKDLVAKVRADGSIRIRSKAASVAAKLRWNSDAGLRSSFAPFTFRKGATTRKRTTRRRPRVVKRRRV